MSEPKPDFGPVFVTEPAHILFISCVHNHQGIMAINLACHMTLCSLLVYSYKIYFVFHYYRFFRLNFIYIEIALHYATVHYRRISVSLTAIYVHLATNCAAIGRM